MRDNGFINCCPSGNVMIDGLQERDYFEQDPDEAYEQRREDDRAIPVDVAMRSASMMSFLTDKLFGQK